MLVLLPPSEGKAAPRRGRALDLARLSSPELTEPRAAALDSLVRLCRDEPERAAGVLGLGPSQAEEVRRNAGLATAPAARADRVYTGVLFAAADLPGLDAAARRRAATRVGIVSALFGLLRPADPIPAYRLSGPVALPGLGPVAQSMSKHWAAHLGPAVETAARGGVVVDLRSSAYVPFWRPARAEAGRVVTVRVVQDAGGRRTAVSHANKATKGRLVRDLLTDGSAPRTPARLAELLGDLGWRVERTPTGLDVLTG